MKDNQTYNVKTTVDKDIFALIEKELDTCEYPISISCWLRQLLIKYFDKKEVIDNE